MTDRPESTFAAPMAPHSRREMVRSRLNAELSQRLRWLIAIRVLVVTSVLLPYGLLQIAALARGGSRTDLDFMYPIAGFAYAATLLYIALQRLLRSRPALQAYVQFAGDLLLVSGFVYHLGGVSSPFSILYLIVVTVASFLLQRRAGLVVASLAWLFYAGTVLGLHFGWLPPPAVAGESLRSVGRLVYSLAIHLFGFYAVAVLTSRLASSAEQAESELIEKREDLADLQVAYRDVIQSIPSGLLTTDTEGRVSSANRAALQILGQQEAALIGRPIIDTGLFDARRWDELRSGEPKDSTQRLEVALPGDAGGRQIGYSVSALTHAEGTPAGHIVIFQDLSEWRQMEQELQLKDRMAAVGELAAGIAHEIGNPLAAISGSAQMLAGALDADSQPQKLLEIIRHESQRLDRKIKTFLKFAKPQERASVRFDIAELLQEHVELLRNSPEVSPRHTLVVELEPPSATIVADPDQISQIFWNLARNGLRAMPDGGILTLTGNAVGDLYTITMADTGTGMGPEARANIFHPYRSFFDSGTGIGMAIVYRIVQEHRGRLRVESRPGRGTVITVELPRSVSVETRLPAGV